MRVLNGDIVEREHAVKGLGYHEDLHIPSQYENSRLGALPRKTYKYVAHPEHHEARVICGI